MLKRCTKCKLELPFDSFRKNKTKYGGLHDTCKPCTKLYLLDYVERNREVITKKKNQWQKSAKGTTLSWIVDEFKDYPCQDCHRYFPPECMDFDHVRGNKRFHIGAIVRLKVSNYSRLRDELLKCELVCSNCHRIRTRQRQEIHEES